MLHAGRSGAFVSALASQLREQYAKESDVRTFDKYHEGNRSEFGLNELLHDITVCRVAQVPSCAQGRHLSYVSAPIWQVESELAKDSRQALFDFNKLVLGAALLKLFVGPAVADADAFIDVLRPAAACCTGQVFVALIPHPAVWDAVADEVLCRELSPRQLL
jgi:hypothetical protein